MQKVDTDAQSRISELAPSPFLEGTRGPAGHQGETVRQSAHKRFASEEVETLGRDGERLDAVTEFTHAANSSESNSDDEAPPVTISSTAPQNSPSVFPPRRAKSKKRKRQRTSTEAGIHREEAALGRDTLLAGPPPGDAGSVDAKPDTPKTSTTSKLLQSSHKAKRKTFTKNGVTYRILHDPGTSNGGRERPIPLAPKADKQSEKLKKLLLDSRLARVATQPGQRRKFLVGQKGMNRKLKHTPSRSKR